jgi:multiple sugar transport system permease protein
MKTFNKIPAAFAVTVISVFLAIVFLGPIIWTVFVSLKPEGTAFVGVLDWFKPPYTIVSYPYMLFNSRVPIWVFNSFVITITTTFLTVFLSALAAYPLAKMEFWGKSKVYFYFLLGLMVPGEATIVPLFITANNLYLIDNYGGMILPIVAGSMNLIIMVTFFKSIPKDLIEVAEIDGAQPFKIFVMIVMPLSKTVVVTVSIFAAIGSWNNFLWPLLCAMSENMFTLPVGLQTLLNTYTIDWVLPCTANMIASIPTILIFLFFERHITQGIAMAGIKG